MKKKLAVGVLSVVLLVGGATAALGATDAAKLSEIKNLTQQMFGIHKQIVDKEAEAGLITQQQADTMKKAIDQRQQNAEQALTNGQAVVPGLGMGMRGGLKFNNGQPWTDDKIKAWDDAMQARLKAQVEAMKQSGKFTDDQIKTWSDAMQAQLKIQEEALKKGTPIPGGFGMPGSKGMRGGCGRYWGAPAPSSTGTSGSASSNTSST